MRYPDNFKQDLPEEDLKRLPPFCSYVGNAEDLQYLKGKLIPTLDVQKLVYVGERESIVVELPDNPTFRPWKELYIIELDPFGEPVVDFKPGAPIVDVDPDTVMDVWELNSLGYTDSDLNDMAQEHLGESWEPGGRGTGSRRKALYDRVMSAMLG